MIRPKHIAEFIGTFAIVFCGTGAIVINQEAGGPVTHIGICMVFGLVVAAMIFALGDVSGAHMNPAVSICFAVAKRFAWREVPSYILFQALGAFAGSLALKWMFPANEMLGATMPAGEALHSLFLEVVLMFILMLVILNVSVGAKEKGMMAAIAIGGTVGFEALFAGPICGASMNPIRSIAPAVVSGHLEHIWIYIVAPVSGALLALLTHQFMYKGYK